MTMLSYKGYLGQIEFDEEAEILHGEVVNTRDVITFQGKSVSEVKRAFHESVDDYLEFCRSRGEAPDKPFSGRFVTRISPELHRQANIAARRSGKSLNAWIQEQLQGAVLRDSAKMMAAETKLGSSSTTQSKRGTTRKKTVLKPSKRKKAHA